MKSTPDFSLLCQTFFSKRLIAQRQASPNTITAYAQTFRLIDDLCPKAAGHLAI